MVKVCSQCGRQGHTKFAHKRDGRFGSVGSMASYMGIKKLSRGG